MQENKMQENEVETAEAAEETAKKEAPKAEKADKGDKKKIKKLEEELAAANAKAEELNERYVRMLAEYDNFRKRTAKERESVYSDAYLDALTNILPALDNLERAAKFSDAESVGRGVQMTLNGVIDVFEKIGVSEIECKEFDPNYHNAVMHVEDEEKGEGEIGLFDKVLIFNEKMGKEKEIQIVTTLRQNALLGYVSKESPLGSALLGRKAGDRVLVSVSEDMSYYVEIRRVERGEDNEELPISGF